MSELEQLLSLLDKLGVEYKRHSDLDFLMENAINLGAVETVCLRGEVDIAFDTAGKSVGNYTNSSGSWRERK